MSLEKTTGFRVRPAAGGLTPARYRDRAAVALSAACVTARDAERRLLAREVHDELGAELTALRYALARVAAAVPDDAAAACAAALASADTALDAAFAASYRLIQQRGVLPRPGELDAEMRAWITSFAERVGLRAAFDYHADPALSPLDDARALALLRITQEALNNVARHAQASAVTIRLSLMVGGATLVIRDNGCGIDPLRAKSLKTGGAMNAHGAGRTSHGLGLSGMRERCDALGGQFAITSRPGGGVELRASLPYRARPPNPSAHARKAAATRNVTMPGRTET
ncbi:MAG: sensor histidine kinase [Janthinobacterium lividum]